MVPQGALKERNQWKIEQAKEWFMETDANDWHSACESTLNYFKSEFWLNC